MNEPTLRRAPRLLRLARFYPLRLLGRMSLFAYRVLIALVLLAGFGTAAVVLSLRYVVLPGIDQHRDRIAAIVSQATGQQVTIGGIEANWNGLHPHLSLREVVVHDAVGRAALELQRVEATLAWRSLAVGAAGTRLIEITAPSLTVRRDADGQLSVAGLPVGGETEGGGFLRWLLIQRSVVIRDAAVVWIDEARSAPELWLKHVNLRLESSGRLHRLGFTAVPPEGLAAPLDLRAEWRGSDLAAFSDWQGRVFVEMRDASLSGWEAWVDPPGGIERGIGALRIWADFRDGMVVSFTSDVELTAVRAKLAGELAELSLDAMRGRLGWRQLNDGFEITAAGLSLTQAGGSPTPPANARLRWRGVAGGELTANVIDLEPWSALAGQVPLDPALRDLLGRYSPRGRLSDIAFSWSGALDSVARWQAKARFEELSVDAGAGGGFSGLAGTIDGSDRGGTLAIESRRFGLTLPTVIARPITLDALDGQASWSGQGRKLALRVSRLSFANGDLAGTLTGEYRATESGPGIVDLNGALSRADGKAVAAYLPLNVSEKTRKWVTQAVVSGRSDDVRLRLRGDLVDFPFSAPGSRGQFLLSAKVQSAQLEYAPGWPRITDLDGDLIFRGTRMEVALRNATIAGARLQRVRASIADVFGDDEILVIEGEAESASADFLRFIAQSPVDGMLDGATAGMRAEGRGRLALKLVLPLRREQGATVAGTFQFINNTLTIDPGAPVLETVNGSLEFSESGIRVNGATAQLLGGPATLNVLSQRDGALRLSITGRATADTLRRELPPALGQALRGATDWRATLNFRRKLGDLLVESSLVGLAIDLPPPFAKAAADSLPLRFEQVSGAQRDRLSIALGRVVSAQMLRRTDVPDPIIERASVVFGGAAAPVPERRGLALSGSLKLLDVEAWRPLASSLAASARAAPAGMPLPVAGASALEIGDIDLRIGRVDAAGRSFHDIVLRTSGQTGGWQGSIVSREVSGDLIWRSAGRGRLIARLKRFDFPAAQDTAAVSPQSKFDDTELPALDVTVDDFLLSGRPLGRLELSAQPEARDWRIDRLRVSNPDATFQIDGMWQSWMVQPRTRVNVRVDIVNGGKLLTRLGYPEGLRGGSGRIEGPLSWAGSPQSLDLATLSGNLMVELVKGQFLTLDPGVGRLLGVFNLQNLPRRIGLDFRDVFSEGFAFDEIAGSLRIAQGAGRLDNFRIQGGSARILMSGELNLAQETQNLQVRVTPSIGDGLALAGALIGGPVAGLASFLVQRVLKDPLAQLATFDYAVTGTWAEPAVNRVPRSDPRSPAGALE